MLSAPASIKSLFDSSCRTTAAASPPPAPSGAPGDELAQSSPPDCLPQRLLVVEADPNRALTIASVLARQGLRIDRAGSFAQALAQLRACSYQLAIINVQRPAAQGLKLVTLLRSASPSCACLAITQAPEVASGVAALQNGAADFLVQPVPPAVLRQKVYGLLAAAPLVVPSSLLVSREPSFAGLIGGTPAMQQLFARLAQLAPLGTPALITGEAGTGKHLLAQALHQLSQRKGPLVRVNTTALAAPELMLHLYGQERPRRDAATDITPGLLERAQGGTLLFADVDELDAGGQRCLRQLLTEPTYSRRGSAELRCADVRVVALSSRPLLALVQRGAFCETLFHRLTPGWLDIPPLRQRRADIPWLAAAFLAYGEPAPPHVPPELPAATLLALLGHSWPGNVRELRELLRQAVAEHRAKGRAHDRWLPPALVEPLLARTRAAREVTVPLGTPLQAVQRDVILMTLAAVAGNKKEAAALLGVSRSARSSRPAVPRLPGWPRPRSAEKAVRGATPLR